MDWHIEKAEEQLAVAIAPQELRAVGARCGDALITLAQAAALKVVLPQPGLNAEGACKLLAKHLEEAALPKTTLEFAQATLNQARVLLPETAIKQDAAMCVQATKALTAIISITTGRGGSSETLAEVIDKYLDAHKHDVRPLGESHQYALRRIAKDEIGKKSVASLQAQDLVQHCKARLESGAKPQTIGQDVASIRTVLKYAETELHIARASNVIAQAKPLLASLAMVAHSTPRTRLPTRDELNRLIGFFLQTHRHTMPMADLIEFALWTGRRIGEICEIKWDEIDRDGRTCTINGGQPFRLLGQAWVIVDKYDKAGRVSPYVFNQRDGRPVRAKSASAAYTRAKVKLGIKDLRFQDLRREAAIRMDRAGISIQEIGAVLGRKDLNTLRRDIQSGPA